MNIKANFKKGCLIVFITLICLIFIKAAVCMLLWNWVVVPLFGLSTISYWQMYGLIALVQLILPSSISSKE